MSTTKNMHDLYLGLGSNLGNKKEIIQKAVLAIEKQIGRVIALSSLYETKPMGFESENIFINAACHVKTNLQPLDVLEKTQSIEREMGRISKSLGGVYADRLIDIDLLLFDSLIAEHQHLILPHPQLHTRSFVLFPLADIAANVIHPVLHQTISQLKDNLVLIIDGNNEIPPVPIS